MKSFGDFPAVSTSCPFDIRYSSDFPFFVVLNAKIKSNQMCFLCLKRMPCTCVILITALG